MNHDGASNRDGAQNYDDVVNRDGFLNRDGATNCDGATNREGANIQADVFCEVTKPSPESFDVVDLLPQQPPFIMVDRLTYYDPVVAKTELTVREDNLFCRNGIMEEAGLIENIAQTCAAKTGYKEKTEPNREGVIKIGFIGMIKRLDMFRNPRVGEKIETMVEIVEEVFNSTLVVTKTVIGDETIAKCEMKIYLTDKAPDKSADTG